MKKNITILLITILSLLSSQQSYANIAEGEVGTCIWYITDENELVIAPADGVSGDLPENGWDEFWDDEISDYYSNVPWGEYKESIFSAKIMPGVNATSCKCMFYGLNNMKNVDLSNFNTQSVTDMEYMFLDCSSLATIISNCEIPSPLKVGTFETLNKRANCNLLVPAGSEALYAAADGWNELAKINGVALDVNPQIPEDAIAYGETGTCIWYITSENELVIAPSDGVSGDLPEEGWNYPYYTPWREYSANIFSAKVMPGVNAKSCSYMFDSLDKMTSADLSGLNTDNLTDMGAMFQVCSSLTSLDLSNFNTAKVTDMGYLFYGCSSLTSLDLSNFDTKNVTSMKTMFYYCSSLTSLDLSNFNTENVKDMQAMFNGCSALTSLDLSNFNTQNVTSMSSMFSGCYSLTSLDLSNFNTENVTDMSWMFNICISLEELNLTGFNTQNVTNVENMFGVCGSLTTIISNNEKPSPLKAGTFESFENRADCTLRVPIGTKVLYAAADGWNELGNIRDENDDAYEMFAERYSMTEDHCYNVQIETIDNPAYQEPQNYELIKETEGQLKNIKDEMSQTKEMAASAFEASQMPEIIDVLFERLDAIDNMLQNLLDYFYENTVEAGDIEDSYGKSPLFLTSKIPFYNSEDYTAELVTYTRYFSKQTQKETSAGWETIVLPFDVQNVMTKDGRLLAPFGSTLAQTGSALPFWLAELKDGQYVAATSIRANVPYIISMPNGDDIYSKNRISGNVIFFAHNATVYASNGTQVKQGANGFAFVPTYDFVEADDYIYAINDEVFSEGAVDYQPGSVFVHNSRTVRPFEAYMLLNQDHGFAPRFLPVMADETDGIVTITTDTDTVSIYDLSGRKINAMRKGVNIVVKNGKAVKIKATTPSSSPQGGGL